MKIKNAERLITLLRTNGVLYFKSKDLEIRIDPSVKGLVSSDRVDPGSTSNNPGDSIRNAQNPPMNGSNNLWAPLTSGYMVPGPPLQAVPPVESEIPHHFNEVRSMLKMGDEELVDKLFPDFSQMGTKEA